MKKHLPKKRAKVADRADREIRSVYDTMAACSSALKIPLSLLKSAKRAGCPAFDGSGRVRVLPLLEWIFSRGDDVEKVNWSEHGKKFDALIKEVKYKRQVGDVISRENVVTGAQEIMGMLFSELDRLFCLEFPPLAKGLDEVSIRQRSELSISKLKGSLQLRFEKMGKAENE